LTEQTELTAARVAMGSIFLTLQNTASTLIAVSGFAFMARIITQEEMGVIAGLTLLTSLATLISDFGLNTSILKHVSELRGREENISDIVVSATNFRTLTCLVIASALFIIAPNLSETLFKTNLYTYTIRLLSIDVVLLSLGPLFNNVLLGAGKLKKIAVFGTVSVMVRWFFITAFLLVGKGLDGILLGWIAGDAILMLMLAASITKFVSFKKQAIRSTRQQILPLLKFASPLYLSSFVAFLYGWYDKALILAYLSLSDLGIYNTVYTAFSVLITIASALGAALLPYYGMAYGRKDHQAISLGIKRASKYTMLTIFPLTLGLLATSKPTLSIFAGPQYETGWTTLAVLSLFGLVYGITPVLSNLLLIYGKTKTILLLSFIPVVSSLALLPLIWILGLFGLAIMRGTSITLSLIMTVYFINKTVKIQIDKSTFKRALAASAMMAVTILVLQQIFPGSHLLPSYILVGAATYIALIRTLKVLNGEDIQLLRQVIGKRAAKYAGKILSVPSEAS